MAEVSQECAKSLKIVPHYLFYFYLLDMGRDDILYVSPGLDQFATKKFDGLMKMSVRIQTDKAFHSLKLDDECRLVDNGRGTVNLKELMNCLLDKDHSKGRQY